MKSNRIQVFGQDELVERLEARGAVYSHCISIRDPDTELPRIIRDRFESVLELTFYDLEEAVTWWSAGEVRIPLPEDIRRVIEYVDATRQVASGYTVHCRQGISRSTAVALGVLYVLTGSEKSAKEALLDARPGAHPLKRIVRFFDAELKSDLITVCNEIWGQPVPEPSEAIDRVEDVRLDGRPPRDSGGVRILFTSDLHSNRDDYARFVNKLSRYDLGIIAGDLTEEFRFLPGIGVASGAHGQNPLLDEEKELKSILFRAKKPVLIVRGNHDSTPWESERNVLNIHNRKVRYRGLNFIGWEGHDLNGGDLRRHIDSHTVLVTHYPPSEFINAFDRSYRERLGSRELWDLIVETRPKMSLFGHLHEMGMIKGVRQDTIFVNGAKNGSPRFVDIDTGAGTIASVPAGEIVREVTLSLTVAESSDVATVRLAGDADPGRSYEE